MTVRNLDRALHPRSVAVIGASAVPGAIGATVLRNIRAGAFAGAVWPVCPDASQLMDLPCVPDIAALPGVPDLAVLALPPEALPQAVADLGARGGRLAVALGRGPGPDGPLRQRMLQAARPHLLRLIGPDSIGMLVPPVGLNASLAHMDAMPGQIALISQSGAIAATLVDWAAERGLGFSHVVSLGEMADVDLGDYLDLIAGDIATRAVLVYMESIPAPRKFLSAARALSRLKPVIAVKAGRSQAGARAAATHTGTLSGADEVVEAALLRAGVLRVGGMSELFGAAETVARYRPMQRARLGIVTNAGGAGVLAVDRLMQIGGTLADLSPETRAALAGLLPADWRPGHPVDIDGDAAPERYAEVVACVAADPGVDVVLVMNCPSARASSRAAAAAVAGLTERGMVARKPVLGCWLGGPSARRARAALRSSGIAAYDNPAAAAAAVGHLTNWGRAQAALLRVPDRGARAEATPAGARAAVAAIFAAVAAEGRAWLTEPEARAAVAAYGIPTGDLRLAADPEAVAAAAAALLGAGHAEVVVKLVSPDLLHKSDVGAVALDLASPGAAAGAAAEMATRVTATRPGIAHRGFLVEPMVRRGRGMELILGVHRDAVFGPVILFGSGGVAVEITRDTAIGLPPLDTTLAAGLIGRTRAGRLMAGYRGEAPVDSGAVQGALIALSHMIEDFPCLRSLDINPLVALPEGVLALDASIEIDPAEVGRTGPNRYMAIRPYPAAWVRELPLREGQVAVLRPVRPEDALLYPDFIARVEAEHIRMRFLAPRRHFPEEMAVRLTQLDYDREMAFVALTAEGEMAGVSRIACDPDHRTAEYALLVRSDLQGLGLGHALMEQLIAYARADGLTQLEGNVLAENRGMRDLIRSLGFEMRVCPDEPELLDTTLKL